MDERGLVPAAAPRLGTALLPPCAYLHAYIHARRRAGVCIGTYIHTYVDGQPSRCNLYIQITQLHMYYTIHRWTAGSFLRMAKRQ